MDVMGGDDLKGTSFLFFFLSLLKGLWLGNIQRLSILTILFLVFLSSCPPIQWSFSLKNTQIFCLIYDNPICHTFIVGSWSSTMQLSLSILHWLIFLKCFFGSIKWDSNLKPQPYTENEVPHASMFRDNSISAQRSWNKHPSKPRGCLFHKSPSQGCYPTWSTLIEKFYFHSIRYHRK